MQQAITVYPGPFAVNQPLSRICILNVERWPAADGLSNESKPL